MTPATEVTQATEVRALQDALAVEHAAIFGIGVAGAHLTEELRDQAQDASIAHVGRVRGWEQLVRDRGGEVPLAAPWYEVPRTPTDQASGLQLLVELEESCAVAARSVVEAAGTDGRDMRDSGSAALTDSAVRATGWRLAMRPQDPSVPVTVPWPGA